MSSDARVSERISSLGRLGVQLGRHLDSVKLRAAGSYKDQMSNVAYALREHGYVAAVAVSMLTCDYPIQVPCASGEVKKIISLAFDPLDRSKVRKKSGTASALRSLGSEYFKRYFPVKTVHPGASNKVNVYASEIIRDVCGSDAWLGGQLWKYLPVLEGQLFDDQLSAFVLYASALKLHYANAVELSAQAVLQPSNAKSLSTVMKATGANSRAEGAVMCEANTLQGRGVSPADLEAESSYRCSEEGVAEKAAVHDPQALRDVVDAILNEELAEDPEFETPEELWRGRWAWCVNGSHSRILERANPQKYGVRSIPGYTQVYRRMFAEAIQEEPITGWDGHVYVSASPKLEHGKTRSIFACDSVSYFAFEALLRPVEKVWMGRRIVLDPGRNGLVGMAERVRLLRSQGAVSLMLDYDDFNSQHTLEAQQIVIQALGQRVGYDPELLAKLVASFERMHVYYKGEEVGVARGTLMSGHRATTFLNSVLNAAYIRLAVGPALYGRLRAMHVGDDVYLSAAHYGDAELVLGAMKRSPCHLNPTKQSTGHVCAEFLRTAITDEACFGYVARAVSSTVSGNWVSEMRLGPREALTTMIQSARTLMNRSQNWGLSELLVSSCARMSCCSRKKVSALLRGEMALETGPTYSSGGRLRWVEVSTGEEALKVDDMALLSTFATDDYLQYKATPTEVVALAREGGSVRPAMVRSSYSKAALSGKTDTTPSLRLSGPYSRPIYGSVSLGDVLKMVVRPGVLSGLPLLQLMKGRLKGELLSELVALEGGNPRAEDLSREAWGSESRGAVVDGVLPYSDAANLVRRMYADVLWVPKPYFM